MREFWNNRFSQQERMYGTEPNEFFKQEIDKLKPGKLLLPAEGEGRNASYASQIGWDVTAFDYAEAGKEKAMHLAKIKSVEFKYEIFSLEDFPIIKNSFDVIALTYVHNFNREKNHKRLITALKNGGVIVIEGFSKKQLNFNSGGPNKLELLFSIEELKNDFAELNIEYIKEEEVELNEGPHHKGKASVIRMIAKKIINEN